MTLWPFSQLHYPSLVFSTNLWLETGLKKIMIFFKYKKSDLVDLNRIVFIFFLLLLFFLIWYVDIYTDVYTYKLFQTCCIQIDLGNCLNRGYMIFAYIKTLDNVHKASPL